MKDLPRALSALIGGAHKRKNRTSSPKRPLFVTPIFGGIVGAAQLSTAYLLSHPASATDIGLTGAGGVYLVWTVPLGALLGTLLSWLLLRLSRRFYDFADCLRSARIAMIPGFGAAILAPMFLGLGPQTPAELWQGFAVLSAIAWVFIVAITQMERTQAR